MKQIYVTYMAQKY